MMHWYGGGFPGMWIGMGLFWIVLIGVIVWLVVQLTHPRGSGAPPIPPAAPGAWPQGPAPTPESPFDILDRRLATGEIDATTYREARAALLESRGGQP